MNPDQGSPAEPNARPTPASPAELAAMQRDDEVCMLQGLDLSTKARAIYLFAEELQISTQEAIDLAYAFVRYAEGSLENWVQEELAQNRPNTGAACTWATWRGGLTGVRLTLRGMVETPVDPELWTRAPGSSSA
jgi:hypothetical protein